MAAEVSEEDDMAALSLHEIEGRILEEVGERINVLTVRSLLERSYRDVFNEFGWSFAKTDGEFWTVPPTSSGTVSVVNGSATVTGSGTAFTSAYSGGILHIGRHACRVLSVAGPTQLTLQTPYGGETEADIPYTLAQPRYTIPVHRLFSIVADAPLEEVPLTSIDVIDPDRRAIGIPRAFAYARVERDGGCMIELHPVPSAAVHVAFVGVGLGSLSLANPDQLIDDILVGPVFSLTLARAYRAIAARKPAEATVWIALAQTTFEEYLRSLQNIQMVDLSAYGLPLAQRPQEVSPVIDGPFWDS